MSSSPSRKLGIDTPSSAATMKAWSVAVLWWRAEITPAGTPIDTEMKVAKSVSSSVGSTRSRMASVTGLRRKMDWPRSPRTRRPYQRTSCTGSGASRPSWREIFCTSSAEASGPAITEAGSPGARCMRTKATVATTSATGSRANRRRAM